MGICGHIHVGIIVSMVLCGCIDIYDYIHLLSPAAPKARDGRYCNAPCPSVRPSVRLSVTFSFRTVTQKRIAVFSRNFAGTCTMGVCCIVFDIDGMFDFVMNFLNIEKNKILRFFFFKISCFLHVSCYFQH